MRLVDHKMEENPCPSCGAPTDAEKLSVAQSRIIELENENRGLYSHLAEADLGFGGWYASLGSLKRFLDHGNVAGAKKLVAALLEDGCKIDHQRCREKRLAALDAALAAAEEEVRRYEWKLITPEDLPDFNDLLLQDMNPPYGAWSVSNKHYKHSMSYEQWMEHGYRWFAKMRIPKDFVGPEER